MKKIDLKAYAKINLTFEILSKLESGYHEIRSVFQAVELYDMISIEKQKKGFLLTGAIISPTKDNLVTKAKENLERYTEKELPCQIYLVKNIPVCAGLGGGSSDAAATIIGLNNLYELNLSLERLVQIGLETGSDVPFFVTNEGTALVGSVGEKIKPTRKKVSKFYVLARPHRRLSTAKMYRLFDKTGKTFFELAQELCPAVKKTYTFLSKISDECGMSGSGPTLFAGFDSYKKASEAVELFGIESFDGDLFICKPSKNTYGIITCE